MDAVGVPQDLPVLIGVMPLRDFNHAEYLQHEVPGVSLPEALVERMSKAGANAAAEGIAIAQELIQAAKDGGRIRGVLLSSSANGVDELIGLARGVSS